MSLDQKLSIWHIFPEKSRHDNGGNGSAGVSRVLSFLGEAAGGSLPVLPGLVLLLCAPDLKGERGKQQVVVLRRATATPREAANPRTAQEGRRGPAQKLPQASWPRRNR